MRNDKMTRALLKAANAAGYAMATREEDLGAPAHLQLDDALRNGHSAAASAGHRSGASFLSLFDPTTFFVGTTADVPAAPPPRALLPSR